MSKPEQEAQISTVNSSINGPRKQRKAQNYFILVLTNFKTQPN
jgi:hypothetical protein